MPRLTLFLSRLIGLFSLLIVLCLVLNKQRMIENITSLVHNPQMLWAFGLLFLLGGLAMVLSHNIWSGGLLTVVVTLIGWLTLARGLVLLYLSPNAAIGLFGMIRFAQLFYLYATIAVVVGGYLTYEGFRGR